MRRYTDRTYFLAAVALVAAAILLALAVPAGATIQTKCTEDSPSHCWNWATMGNHKRGVVTLSGNVRVVGPRTFARLWDTGHIAYTITVDGVRYPHMLKRMKGDRTALALYSCLCNVQNY